MNKDKDLVYDFSGYATKAGILCSDGRKILKNAFKDNDGKKVPLVWQHLHDDPANILGHAYLEDKDGDVYAYCVFNSTPAGQNAKALVQHKDIDALSIFANQLQEKNKLVHSGNIRELSMVLAGANPGAKIDYISFAHSDGTEDVSDSEAIIYMNQPLEIKEKEVEEDKSIKHADSTSTSGNDETVGDVFNTLTPKQKNVVYALIANALEQNSGDMQQSADENQNGKQKSKNNEGDTVMKKNVFNKDGSETERPSLTHAQFEEITADALKTGSFRASFLAHVVDYGIENIDYLFPDAKTVGDPAFIKRDMGWVTGFMNGTRHTPFSRIKSLATDITADEARARGYVKGDLKKEEVIKMLKRITTPTTVYKKQKIDRDDIVDITDLDVVAFLKGEMHFMLDEEVARAGLIGDGRASDAEGKINEDNIRPIYTDIDMYAYHLFLNSDDTALETVDAIAAARKEYKGSGNPVMYTTTEFLTTMLLIRDTLGHRQYRTTADLAAELRVSSIVEVPVMTGVSRTVDGGDDPDFDADLQAIILNPIDYVFGADKGGQLGMFDDFDIDYNQYKYLIETRCSGALVLPRAAIVVEKKQAPG